MSGSRGPPRTTHAGGWTLHLPARISCPDDTHCKAVGNGGIIVSWNGTSWSSPESSGTSSTLYGVSCPTAMFCRAVGGRGLVGDEGTIVSWNGTSWSPSCCFSDSLRGVSCPTEMFCKAVGYPSNSLQGAILSSNGTSWSFDSPGIVPTLFGVSCQMATFCKAVGNGGTIVSWNGTGWSGDSSGTTNFLRGAGCPTATLCKAIGDGGTILGMVTQTLTNVDAGFALDLFQTGCLDGVSITQTNSNHPNATPSQQTGKYWTITPSPAGCTSGYSAFLTLPTSFTPDAGSKVCRYTGTGTIWDCAQNGFTASTISRWGITQFSDWAAATSPPTAVTLRGLSARWTRHGTEVRWRTAQETGLLGFNLYRSGVKVNETLIAARGRTSGAAYRLLDRTARARGAASYRLQAVRTDGTRAWIGTAVATRSSSEPRRIRRNSGSLPEALAASAALTDDQRSG